MYSLLWLKMVLSWHAVKIHNSCFNNNNNNNNNNLFLIECYLQWQINSALQLVSLNIKISTNSKSNYILQLTWQYAIHNLTTIERIAWKKKIWIEFLKIYTDPILRNCNGSSFHRCGAAAWNACSPRVASILPLGGFNKIPELDLRFTRTCVW